MSFLRATLGLHLLWALMAVSIGPAGESAVNGDFAHTRSLDAVAHEGTLTLHRLGIPPSSLDGGLEFSGLHCYREDHKPLPGSIKDRNRP